MYFWNKKKNVTPVMISEKCIIVYLNSYSKPDFKISSEKKLILYNKQITCLDISTDIFFSTHGKPLKKFKNGSFKVLLR